jgi:putative tryptophan/tyrosine transport system substrate-binding protein
MGARVRRREFIALVGGAVLAGPCRVSAQPTGRSYRVGTIGVHNIFAEPYQLAFVQRLGELGFVEGRNLTIERLHADGKLERLPALATELAKLECDVFFGSGHEGTLATLAQSNRDTPIVFIAVDLDPVATGDVASSAARRPSHWRDGAAFGAAGQTC